MRVSAFQAVWPCRIAMMRVGSFKRERAGTDQARTSRLFSVYVPDSVASPST